MGPTSTRIIPRLIAVVACAMAACSGGATDGAKPGGSSSGSSGDDGNDEGSSGGTSGGTSGTSGGATDAGSSGTTDGAAASANHGFPPSWIDGTACASEPQVQTWKYAEGTFILRQSLCTNFEAPFLYLFVGSTKALLIDSGTGAVDMRPHVMGLLAGKTVELVVAHSHGHGDHVGGDGAFAGKPSTTVVGTSANAAKTFFGITGTNASTYDLGGRVLDVLPIPGHQSAHLAFYDREQKLLLTGDTLYPGRLYIDDWNSYRTSIPRLVTFVDAGHPVTHVLGAHIELPKTGADYPMGAKTHPNEHVLQLSDADLRELDTAVKAMGATPKRETHAGFIIYP